MHTYYGFTQARMDAAVKTKTQNGIQHTATDTPGINMDDEIAQFREHLRVAVWEGRARPPLKAWYA
jgi:hypothetical protein